jgi:hypothetical protein
MPINLNEQVRATVYADEEPEIPALNKEWLDTLANLDYYLEQTRRAYDTRRNYWAGKTIDNRKHGPKAMPWPGASDMDTHIVEERITKLVSLCLRGFERSHIQAYPIGEDDITRSRVISRFLKYMRENWIEDLAKTAERNANYMFEKGILVTMVGWEKAFVRDIEELKIEDLADEAIQQLYEEDYQARVAEGLAARHQVEYEDALKAVQTLAEDGFAELPVDREVVSRPTVRACSPDSDVFYPSWIEDPQRSPYVFYRELATPQEVLGRVRSEEWNEGWAEHVVEHCRGMGTASNPGINNRNNIPNNPLSRFQAVDNGLIELVWMYQRLIDEKTGAEGIYCTVFCPAYTDAHGKAQNYAIRYQLKGATCYPIKVTRLFNDEARMYDVRTLPDILRSAQNTVKAERDARTDANSLRNCPPLQYDRRPPKGNWAPGGLIGGSGNVRFADTPNPNPQSMNDEEIMLRQVNRMLGLDPDDPTGQAVVDFFVGKFLRHFADVLGLAYEQYQRYGPDEVMFRVTGIPEMTRMDNRPGEKLDITITFDSLFSDPDNVEQMIANVSTLFQFDDAGAIDKTAWLSVAMQAISPIFAQQLLKPADESVRDLQRKVMEDITQIESGFAVDARNGGAGAPVALETIQMWAQRPDNAAKLKANPLLAESLQNYAQQYLFNIQQQENAVTGRLGAPPAEFPVNRGMEQGGTPQAPPMEQNGAPQEY